MSIHNERRCDRTYCNKPITGPYTVVEVKYHHPAKLDLCKECEAEFTLWLGKHPLWNTTVENIANGGAAGGPSGDGYPTRQQAQDFLIQKATPTSYANS